MSESADQHATREERLAQKLRANLRLRKAQSRALDTQEPREPVSDSQELPKERGES